MFAKTLELKSRTFLNLVLKIKYVFLPSKVYGNNLWICLKLEVLFLLLYANELKCKKQDSRISRTHS